MSLCSVCVCCTPQHRVVIGPVAKSDLSRIFLNTELVQAACGNYLDRVFLARGCQRIDRGASRFIDDEGIDVEFPDPFFKRTNRDRESRGRSRECVDIGGRRATASIEQRSQTQPVDTAPGMPGIEWRQSVGNVPESLCVNATEPQ